MTDQIKQKWKGNWITKESNLLEIKKILSK